MTVISVIPAAQGCKDRYRAASLLALQSSRVMDGPCVTFSQIRNLWV